MTNDLFSYRQRNIQLFNMKHDNYVRFFFCRIRAQDRKVFSCFDNVRIFESAFFFPVNAKSIRNKKKIEFLYQDRGKLKLNCLRY